MNPFLDTLAVELRAAAEREAARPARVRLPRLPRLRAVVPALAVGLAVVALLLALPFGGTPERELRPVPVGVAAYAGTYAHPGSVAPRLWIHDGSIRLLDGDESGLFGFIALRGDVMTLRVDARTGPIQWPEVGCHGASRQAAGRYRVALAGDQLRFRLIADPCRTRADVLTSRPWRRTGP